METKNKAKGAQQCSALWACVRGSVAIVRMGGEVEPRTRERQNQNNHVVGCLAEKGVQAHLFGERARCSLHTSPNLHTSLSDL